MIKQALSEHASIRQAAKALGCDQSTLVRKIQKYQLTRHISYEDYGVFIYKSFSFKKEYSTKKVDFHQNLYLLRGG